MKLIYKYMNFKHWLNTREATLSYSPNGGVGDIARFSLPVSRIIRRKDMYGKIPRRRRRPSRRRYIEQQEQKKNKF
jgi:hypothetical protein